MIDKKLKAIGIGEILWDLLPKGKQLGGAPTNFAWHARQLGLDSAIISAVGNDDSGREIQEEVKLMDIRNYIAINDRPTGTVSVELNDKGIPEYIIHENVAWDYISQMAESTHFIIESDVICFGSLAQRSAFSRKTIQEVLQKTSEKSLRVFDINMRQQFYSKGIIEESLMLSNVLKINDEELVVFSSMFGLKGAEESVCKQIIKRFDLNLLALTKGENGSNLYTSDSSSFIETPKITVADTVGAGDSFTAAMAVGYLNGLPLARVHQLAVDVSAFVCTQKGGTPVLPTRLLEF